MISSGKVKQRALTIIAPVLKDKTVRLRELLQSMGSAPETDASLGLCKSSSTHFARFVLVTDGACPDRLFFTSNYDGGPEDYVKELGKSAGPAMDAIWSFCSGYHAGDALDPERWAHFVERHKQEEQMFFVSHPGISASGIKRAAKLRAGLERIFDSVDSALLAELDALGCPNARHGSKQPLSAGKTPRWIGRLLERLVGIDTRAGNPNTIVKAPYHVSAVEDSGVHNALTIVAPIKGGLFPLLILRLVLFLGSLGVRNAWGSLNGITSIHFARWLILDGGKTLLFESNYDGSWESYIDEFVDVSSAGLNAIWANCVGFPERGCKDIESFKDVIRKHQHPALIFYRAYPDLTVKNVLANNSVSVAAQAFLNSGDVTKVLAGSCEKIV